MDRRQLPVDNADLIASLNPAASRTDRLERALREIANRHGSDFAPHGHNLGVPIYVFHGGDYAAAVADVEERFAGTVEALSPDTPGITLIDMGGWTMVGQAPT